MRYAEQPVRLNPGGHSVATPEVFVGKLLEDIAPRSYGSVQIQLLKSNYAMSELRTVDAYNVTEEAEDVDDAPSGAYVQVFRVGSQYFFDGFALGKQDGGGGEGGEWTMQTLASSASCASPVMTLAMTEGHSYTVHWKALVTGASGTFRGAMQFLPDPMGSPVEVDWGYFTITDSTNGGTFQGFFTVDNWAYESVNIEMMLSVSGGYAQADSTRIIYQDKAP